MTAGAAQLLAPAEFPKVMAVVEPHVLELNGTQQGLLLMALFPHTGMVRDFGPRFGLLVSQGDILGELVQAIEFPFDFARKPRLEMTGRTGYISVR